MDTLEIIKTLARINNFPMDLIVFDFQTLEYSIIKTDENEVVGFYVRSYPHNTKGSMLQYLLVDKEHRNKGYGTILMNHYIQWCKNNNRTKSLVQMKDRSLMKFYEKFGYEFFRIESGLIDMLKTISD